MKTISKIIYTVIVCRFLMAIRGRLLSNAHVDPTKYLLIEYLPSDGFAMVFGYADNPTTLHYLMCDMLEHGFATTSGGRMTVVNPIGNNMFKSAFSEERIGPYRLHSTSRGRWYDIAQQYGMRRDVIDSMCES